MGNCPECGSDQIMQHGGTGNIVYLECKDCGHEWIEDEAVNDMFT